MIFLTIGWKDWEVGSEEEEDSDGSDGWIEVSSDEEHQIDISDSEDEEEPKPPQPKSDPTNSALATSKVSLLESLSNFKYLPLPISPNSRNSVPRPL